METTRNFQTKVKSFIEMHNHKNFSARDLKEKWDNFLSNSTEILFFDSKIDRHWSGDFKNQISNIEYDISIINNDWNKIVKFTVIFGGLYTPYAHSSLNRSFSHIMGFSKENEDFYQKSSNIMLNKFPKMFEDYFKQIKTSSCEELIANLVKFTKNSTPFLIKEFGYNEKELHVIFSRGEIYQELETSEKDGEKYIGYAKKERFVDVLHVRFNYLTKECQFSRPSDCRSEAISSNLNKIDSTPILMDCSLDKIYDLLMGNDEELYNKLFSMEKDFEFLGKKIQEFLDTEILSAEQKQNFCNRRQNLLSKLEDTNLFKTW